MISALSVTAAPPSISCDEVGTAVSAEAVRHPTHTRNQNGVLRTASAVVVELSSTTKQKIGPAPSRTAHSFSGEEVVRRVSAPRRLQLEHAGHEHFSFASEPRFST